MSREDWKRAQCFSVMVQAWHCLGPLQLIAIFLRHEKNVPYSEFYLAMMEWAEGNPQTLPGCQRRVLDDCLEAVLIGEGTFSYVNPVFGDIVWPLEEGLFLETAHRLDIYYKDIQQFLQDYEIDEDVLSELLQYQHAMVRLPKRPAPLLLTYDFGAYFSKIFNQEYAPLEKRGNTLIFSGEIPEYSWPDFAREIVWYGRKGGSSLYTGEVQYA